MEKNAPRQSKAGSHSGLSSEWDVVSESGVGALERMSAASLSSEEESSEAVIIFGGKGEGARPSGSTLSCVTSPVRGDSGVLGQQFASVYSDIESDSESLRNETWQAKHKRLLSAVSDVASDSGQREASHACGRVEPTMPIEQRLLDQIARLAEELDESQEQAKLLLLQNDRLMSENDLLKKSVQELSSSRRSRPDERGASDTDSGQSDAERIALAVAAGMVIIGLAKKRFVLSGIGLMGAAVFGGCIGLYQLVSTLNDRPRKAEAA